MDLQKLITGYEKMLTDLGKFISSAENTAEDNIELALKNAKESLRELKSFSEEEVEHIEQYVIRDLRNASKQSEASGKELADWFKFDIELLESRLWETVAAIADPTWLTLAEFKEKAFYSEYKTGELTGPATLKCKSCGKEHHFYKVSHIPPCSECKHTTFERVE